MDTACFNGNQPMKQLLQGLHISYANFAPYSPLCAVMKVNEIEKFFGDFVVNITRSLDAWTFCMLVSNLMVPIKNHVEPCTILPYQARISYVVKLLSF